MTSSFSGEPVPHRRFNPLNGSHVLVSPQRALRPWQGAVEKLQEGERPNYDPHCYLCPGNLRTGGARNANYSATFVFPNDFPALTSETGPTVDVDRLFRTEAASGEMRVICFSPDHSATLPKLPKSAIRAVVDAWCAESGALGAHYPWVQVFENKGAAMGCSNPHPHGQIWATSFVPDEPAREDANQRAWLARHGRSMLLDVAERETALGERVVFANEDWLAIVPFWAAWPFETLLLPRFAIARLPDLEPRRRDSLAEALRALTTRYDNLFETSFPYSMGWHGAPFDGDAEGWQLHAHFYPPLLRSATVRKFMVGFEMLAEPQRDLTPEQAAERLRSAGGVHYRSRP